MVTVVLVRSKQGNILDLAHLKRAVQFGQFLNKELKFHLGGKNTSFADLCKQTDTNFCGDNLPLGVFTVCTCYVKKSKDKVRRH
jgi:hypothetical protein